ncbi:MAG: GNAT family N-acetyltransferase [Rhodobacteraceae bacterium]|nr:GNAT family N-acetyltransferase [Paracoccaceae bacterium]
MAELIIRPLRPEDRAEWRRLWTGYLEFYETRLPQGTYQTTFARLLDPELPEMNARIADLDGRPVGLVHFLYHRHCWRPEGVCYLQDLYADPAARGMGVGRKLIEAVYAAADAAGMPSVYWLTQDFNTTARTLYDRIGQVTPFVKYVRG